MSIREIFNEYAPPNFANELIDETLLFADYLMPQSFYEDLIYTTIFGNYGIRPINMAINLLPSILFEIDDFLLERKDDIINLYFTVRNTINPTTKKNINSITYSLYKIISRHYMIYTDEYFDEGEDYEREDSHLEFIFSDEHPQMWSYFRIIFRKYKNNFLNL